jgi:hypothetical protein
MNEQWNTVDGSPNPLLLPVKQDAWLVDHHPDKHIQPASYKSHARVRIGGDQGWDSDKWVLWIGVGDFIWPMGKYDIKHWKKGGFTFSRADGSANQYRGTSFSLARKSGHRPLEVIEEALNTADRFIMFAVSPDGKIRTRVWNCQNDHWINDKPGGKKPTKLRRSRVPAEGQTDAPKPEFQFTPPVVKQRGAHWAQGSGRAPQMFMAPTLKRLTKQWVDENFDDIIYGMGFNGFHVPLEWGQPTQALLYLLRKCEEAGAWVHLWMYGDQQHGTAPESLDDDRAHQRAVISVIKQFNNWSMGPGFDLQEWVDEGEVRRWINTCEGVGGRMYGARKRANHDETPPGPGDEPFPGDYAGWEWHIIPKDTWPEQMWAAIAQSGKRVMWEERGRLRTQGRAKDFTSQSQLVRAIEQAVEANVANIWGIGNECGDWGSEPFDRKHWGRLNNAMGGPIGRGTQPPPPPPNGGVPELKDVKVMHPGTKSVLTWPVVPANDNEPTECHEWVVDGDKVTMKWRRLNEKYFPFHAVERDGEIEPEYLGNLWLILVHDHGPNQWYGAVPTEQMRWERERNETAYSIEGHIMDDATPRPREGDLVGTFCAGPSRHFPDKPQYRYRGRVEWFIWTTNGRLKRYVPPVEPKKPAAPSHMVATPLSPTLVEIQWRDNSDNETGFVMEMRHPGGSWVVIGRPSANTTAFNVLADPDTTYEFRVKATGVNGDSDFSSSVAVTTPKEGEPPPTGECCEIACGAGLQLQALEDKFNKEVAAPALAAVDGFSWPLKWSDILQIPAAAQKIYALIPVAEEIFRQFREVKKDLLDTCKEE